MVRVVTPGESALTGSGPHPAAPGGEDASLGHAVKLVALLYVVVRVRTVRSRKVDTNTAYSQFCPLRC
eukprot:2290841-Prymnesium_polylepis.1